MHVRLQQQEEEEDQEQTGGTTAVSGGGRGPRPGVHVPSGWQTPDAQWVDGSRAALKASPLRDVTEI